MNKKEQAIKLDALISEKLKVLFADLMKELREYDNVKNKRNAELVKIQKEYEKKLADVFKNAAKKTT